MAGPTLGSLTAANAVLMLGVTNLYNTPQQLQGFAADDIYDMPQIRSAETLMGVDGTLSAGFIFVPIVQSITLQANSSSNLFFEQWWANQQVAEDVYSGFGTIALTSLGSKYVMTNGFLTGYTPAPPARRILQPRRYEITWNLVLPNPAATAASITPT
jgi:hypothetical protein